MEKKWIGADRKVGENKTKKLCPQHWGKKKRIIRKAPSILLNAAEGAKVGNIVF